LFIFCTFPGVVGSRTNLWKYCPPWKLYKWLIETLIWPTLHFKCFWWKMLSIFIYKRLKLPFSVRYQSLKCCINLWDTIGDTIVGLSIYWTLHSVPLELCQEKDLLIRKLWFFPLSTGLQHGQSPRISHYIFSLYWHMSKFTSKFS
jgi:hypothetical protein